ncbi:hypothetical protein FACS189447_03230 [Spirochaetia bacterium]|nr:hypothetical protein FACS189447_03230 [Spirochaetia bacterium]
MAEKRPTREENVDIETLIKKQGLADRRNTRIARRQSIGFYNDDIKPGSNIKSIFYDPLMLDTNMYNGGIRTISPYYGRPISYRILREVSRKAWILNICILNVIRKVRPYLKPSTSENQRGFRIKKRDTDEMSEAEQQTAKELTQFIMKTGDVDDRFRKDDLDKYTTKILRDLFQLDQIATELQRNRIGDLCAFWAMDAATIEVALPNDDGIEYLQVIYNVPYGDFTGDEMIFDCMNPRTDIEKAGYGYSLVEQAIDLVTSSINTFMYNAGFFTENKLPRGILLLQGDADTDEVEEIEDYIVNIMSGPPSSQWRIPIIPSGKPDGGAEGGSRRFEWVNLQGTNKEMEFQSWFDLQLSGIVALFGESMESIGLHSQKSQPLIGVDASPKVESTKSLVLGDVLGWLQKHFNKIIELKNPEYEMEIVGYEKDDPRLTMDIDKSEVDNYKSIDEKRIEKGLKPFDKPWAQVPLNPYVVQLLGQENQGGGSPFGDMGDDEDSEGGDETGEESEDEGEEAGEDGNIKGDDDNKGGSGWDNIEQQQGEGGDVEKSLNRKGVVRIFIK